MTKVVGSRDQGRLGADLQGSKYFTNVILNLISYSNIGTHGGGWSPLGQTDISSCRCCKGDWEKRHTTSSTSKHFCQSELQGTVENKSLVWRLTFSVVGRMFTCRRLNIFWRLNIKGKWQQQLRMLNLPNLNKLDQETWLCRTHLDDFLVKIWTILDHTRTRLTWL